MHHQHRNYNIRTVETSDALANEFLRCTWVLCQGFRCGGMLFLNDSFSPDGAQEYAVVRESDGQQLDSLTVSWMDDDRLRSALAALVSGELPLEPIGWVNVRDALGHESRACHYCM